MEDITAAFTNVVGRLRALEARHAPAESLTNLLLNGGFEAWALGNGPFTANGTFADNWTLVLGAGSTASVTRTSTHADYSQFAAQIVYTHVATTLFRQSVAARFGSYSVAVSARVKAGVAGAVRLERGALVSAYHSGSGAWETLTLVGTDAVLPVDVAFHASGTFQVDNVMVVQGFAPVDYVADRS